MRAKCHSLTELVNRKQMPWLPSQITLEQPQGKEEKMGTTLDGRVCTMQGRAKGEKTEIVEAE